MGSSDRRRPRRLPVLCLLALTAVAVSAEASVLRGLTVQQLRESAELIVSAKVVSVESQRTDTTIDTVVRLRVEHAFQGRSARRITIRVPGGVLDGRRLVVPGSPSFARGENVLVFLYADGREYRPVGLFQGVWRLEDFDAPTARASDSGGASLLLPEGGSMAVEQYERALEQLVGDGGVR